MPNRRHQRGWSLIVMLLALVIAGLVAWIVMSRFLQSNQPSAAAEAGVASPMDQTRQQRTIADMLAIARAISTMYVDSGSHPQALTELQRQGYLAQLPVADAWGNAWIYETGPQGYTLTSLGADGREGPAPPSPWAGGVYECDLVLTNGQLTQAPSGR